METSVIADYEITSFLGKKTSKYPEVLDVIAGKIPGVIYKEVDKKSATRLRGRLVYYQKHYSKIQIVTRGNEVLVYRKDAI